MPQKTNFAVPQELLTQSLSHSSFQLPQLIERRISRDHTRKLLLELADGEIIECVTMFMSKSRTLCLSTQVGCPLGCVFCSTGRCGFTRNLQSHEITGQAIIAANDLFNTYKIWPDRIVFMGMGEPFLNLNNLSIAIHDLTNIHKLRISWRKIIISTVGIPHQLINFANMRIALPAISLHAPNQQLRNELMPGAKQWPLQELIECLQQYPLPGRERLIIEYILINRINDYTEHAQELVELIRPLKAKINLIPCNPVPGTHYAPSSARRTDNFYAILKANGQTVFLRRGLGPDISAACGQLRATRKQTLTTML